ncbi:hypothetical protein C8R46DRAFT_1198844 [Mycena filopes]|nr:hypothetical protein C8R46DRAFT_1198844 [Mycena filopes]
MPKAPSVPPASAPQLAASDGPSIVRSKALKQYRLGETDLNSIMPVKIRPHPVGVGARYYNLKDVVALDECLNSALPDPAERAEESGKQIKAFEAMKKYKLNRAQLARIKPVSEVHMPERKVPIVLVYNLSDVEALAAPIAAAAVYAMAAPPRPPHAPVAGSSTGRGTARARTASRRRHDDDYYDSFAFDGAFDGMSGEDAAYKFAEVTGICGPAMAYHNEY